MRGVAVALGIEFIPRIAEAGGKAQSLDIVAEIVSTLRIERIRAGYRGRRRAGDREATEIAGVGNSVGRARIGHAALAAAAPLIEEAGLQVQLVVEELADELLIRYLSSVKNKGAKFKRQDPFRDKLFSDVSTAFEFFNNNNYLSPDVAETIKQKWKVTQNFLDLIEAEKAAVPDVFAAFKAEFWDLQLSWVEAVLRSRDDFDRSTLNAVKAKAASIDVTRGLETIMSKVK